MIYWNVEPLMRDHGLSTAYQLAKRTKISRPGALRVLSGHPVERIDVATLEAIASEFGVEDPLTLLRYVPG